MPGWYVSQVSVAVGSAWDVARIPSSTSRYDAAGAAAPGRQSSSRLSVTTYARFTSRPRDIATYRSSRPIPGAATVCVSSTVMPCVRAVLVA